MVWVRKAEFPTLRRAPAAYSWYATLPVAMGPF
jgi:hypothetical protein